MSQPYRKEKLLAWQPDLETHLGTVRDSGAEVLLKFLTDRTRDTFMRFKNRLRAYEKAGGERLVPIRDSGELAGGILFYALDAAGDLPLDFVLERGAGSREERERWARDLAEGLEALHGAELPHGRLEPHACLLGPDGGLRLTDPDFLGTGGAPEADLVVLESLQEELAEAEGPPLAESFGELLAAYRAAPSPKPHRKPPTHRRPDPGSRDPDRPSGPGPYRIPLWARLLGLGLGLTIGWGLLRLLGVLGG